MILAGCSSTATDSSASEKGTSNNTSFSISEDEVNIPGLHITEDRVEFDPAVMDDALDAIAKE